MSSFTPIASTVGGLLIGLSAAALLYFNGRIAGVSGVLGQALAPDEGERSWRVMFLAGLVVGGAALFVLSPGLFERSTEGASHWPLIALAGVLVGFGTRLGNGCTSGHGVCGIARFSWRSIAATCVFMLTGMGTVYVVRHLLGAAS